MIVTCVYIHVKTGSVADFIKETTLNHLESVTEPGNLRFDLIQQVDDKCRFMLYEAYDSEESATHHKSTPHYIRWRDSVAGMMEEPRTGIKHLILQPADSSKW